MNHIVAVDHGNKSIKTSCNYKYATGYTISVNEPILKQDLLVYQGEYYSMSSERFPIMERKTEDERCFILTLPAIANAFSGHADTKEPIDIILGVGLDISNYGKYKKDFKEYFIRNNIEFIFNESYFKINISDVFVFPQGYSGYITRFSEYRTLPICNIVDIGSHTIDLLTVENGLLNIKSCVCLKEGISKLFNEISQESQKIGFKIMDSQIENIILNRRVEFIDDEIINLVLAKVQAYTSDLLNRIYEYGFELKNPTVFHGGGALLLKDYIKNAGRVKHAEFLNEFSNADGYLLLTQQALMKRRF